MASRPVRRRSPGCSSSQRAPPAGVDQRGAGLRARGPRSGPASSRPARRTTRVDHRRHRAAGRSCRARCGGPGGRPRSGGPRRSSLGVSASQPGDDLARRQALVLVDRQVSRRASAPPVIARPPAAGAVRRRRRADGVGPALVGPAAPATRSNSERTHGPAASTSRRRTPRDARRTHRSTTCMAVVSGAATVAPTTRVQPPLDLAADRIVGGSVMASISRRSGRRRRRPGSPARWPARAGSSSGTAARRPASAAGGRRPRRVRRARPRPRPRRRPRR